VVRFCLFLSPLIIAAERDHLDVVQLLLRVPGIDVNLQEENGICPLIWSCFNGNTGMVNALLNKKNILVNAQDIDKSSNFQKKIQKKR
jgi:ankyrin repeat protein